MKKWIGIALLCVVILAGCDLFTRDFYLTEADFPGLMLKINGGSLPTQTIAPALSMDVSSYLLTFVGPTTADNFTTTISNAGLFSRTGLKPGSWTVAANAFNADTPTPTLIGAIGGVAGTTQAFTITAGSSANVNVSVVPLTGTGKGDLRIFVSWPDDVGPGVETLTGSLTPGPGDISSSFVLTTGTTRTATYNTNDTPNVIPQLNSGYYLMALQLRDSGSVLLWGWIEAVRVLADKTTDTGTNFALTTLTGAGGVSLVANANMQNPITITFTPATITPDLKLNTTALSVSASMTPAGSYTYQWYLDGTAVSGATSSTISLPANSPLLTLGRHNLSLLVTSGSILSSNTIPFTVVP
jgi:hypothetical protein